MRDDKLSDEEKKDNETYKSSRVISLLENTSIYRVFRANYIQSMINDKTNTLVHISKWEDPFEAFLLKQKVRHEGNFVDVSSFYNDVYGQCWSLNDEETDATWRIYSPNKDGILVKSTVGKIWNSFYNTCHKGASYKYAIGKVSYFSESEIISRYFGTSFSAILDSSLRGLTKTLLVKRLEFKHENEIRIIYHDIDSIAKNNLISYTIDPSEIIEEITADPRMDSSLYDILRNCFEKHGFNLKKSTLYQLPDLHLNLDSDPL